MNSYNNHHYPIVTVDLQMYFLVQVSSSSSVFALFTIAECQERTSPLMEYVILNAFYLKFKYLKLVCHIY